MDQLLQAGWSVLLGAGLGFLFDMLGGARDRARLPAWAADGLFALAAVAELFVGGLAAREGRPRLYMALFGAGGLALWLGAVSPVTRPLWGRLWAEAGGQAL